jgi:hypothetical protein
VGRLRWLTTTLNTGLSPSAADGWAPTEVLVVKTCFTDRYHDILYTFFV